MLLLQMLIGEDFVSPSGGGEKLHRWCAFGKMIDGIRLAAQTQDSRQGIVPGGQSRDEFAERIAHHSE
jgi:hypothetical protein